MTRTQTQTNSGHQAVERENIQTTPISRRAAIAAVGAAAAAPLAFAQSTAHKQLVTPEELGFDVASGTYTLPPLKFDYEAYEPFMDAETMRLHHSKHHASYVKGLNTALEKLAEIRSGSGDSALIKHWSRELAFHGSGHFNHCIFWMILCPPALGCDKKEPEGELEHAINRDFGSFAQFSMQFQAAANSVEGSGWAWLVYEPISKRLLIMQAEKHQDLSIWGVIPLMGVDVWEHAYYLKYQNRRADYVKAFINTVNWERVNDLFDRARGV